MPRQPMSGRARPSSGRRRPIGPLSARNGGCVPRSAGRKCRSRSTTMCSCSRRSIPARRRRPVPERPRPPRPPMPAIADFLQARRAGVRVPGGPCRRARIQARLCARRSRRRSHARADRRYLYLRNRRQWPLRHAGGRVAPRRKAHLARSRLQSVAQHQYRRPARRIWRRISGRGPAPYHGDRRARAAPYGAQARRARAHGEGREVAALQVERARRICQEYPPGLGHARGRARHRHRAALAGAQAAKFRAVCAAGTGMCGRSRRPSSSS
jgi:hypothetical protein